MSARILISGLLAVLAGTAATAGTAGKTCEGMQNLQTPYPLRLYAKSLIPRLGT